MPEEHAPSQQPATPKKPERKYIETGEPENKGLMIGVGVVVLIVFGIFVYFMLFHFHDMFFQKVVVEK